MRTNGWTACSYPAALQGAAVSIVSNEQCRAAMLHAPLDFRMVRHWASPPKYSGYSGYSGH